LVVTVSHMPAVPHYLTHAYLLRTRYFTPYTPPAAIATTAPATHCHTLFRILHHCATALHISRTPYLHHTAVHTTAHHYLTTTAHYRTPHLPHALPLTCHRDTPRLPVTLHHAPFAQCTHRGLLPACLLHLYATTPAFCHLHTARAAPAALRTQECTHT